MRKTILILALLIGFTAPAFAGYTGGGTAVDPVTGTTSISQVTPGVTNGVYNNSIEPCGDQTNLACRTFGGPVRTQQMVGTGAVPSTASDATSATFLLPTGMKTFQGVITCTGTCIQTQTIYGGYSSTASTTTFDVVCTLTLNATTTDHAFCKTDTNFPYWFAKTTLTAGTTPLSLLNVSY